MLTKTGHEVNIENMEPLKLENMIVSEEYFWLVTALALACAAEEIGTAIPPVGESTADIVGLFNRAIRQGALAADELCTVRTAVWHKLCYMVEFVNNHTVFDTKISLALSKAFVSYWLVFQLIQSQWQEKLKAEELADTYNFLDGLLGDGAELEKIEQKLAKQQKPDFDQCIYLRSNWQRVRAFWQDLYSQLFCRLLGQAAEIIC